MKGTVLQMLYHVRELDMILRRQVAGSRVMCHVSCVLLQDYDGDGVSDCVGVHVAGVGVIRSRSSASNILDTASTNLTSTAYLNTWARYQLDGYCLAVLFSSKVRHVCRCPLELQTRVREH